MKKLCCIFNYPPLYRTDIFRKLDQSFDTQFYFGEEVCEGKKSGIAKLDYSIFSKAPIEFKNKIYFNHFAWRTKTWWLPLKGYEFFLITGDFVYSYIPFLLLCKVLGKKVYGWGHGAKTREGISRFLNDFLYKNLSGFLSYGEGGKRRLVELGYNEHKIDVIYNSLTDKCSEEKLDSTIFCDFFKNHYPILLFVGRLTPQKRLDWSIKCLSNLKSKGKICNLVIIGTGPVENDLKTLASLSGVKNQVWFYGECYNDAINSEMIYNADLCISPGNVGLTALHALQYGTPVISHDDFETQMPEYEVIEQYKTGLLYQHNNFEDFCDKIEEWLEFSKGKREEIRQNCYAMINGKWNSRNQLEILKRVLESDGE